MNVLLLRVGFTSLNMYQLVSGQRVQKQVDKGSGTYYVWASHLIAHMYAHVHMPLTRALTSAPRLYLVPWDSAAAHAHSMRPSTNTCALKHTHTQGIKLDLKDADTWK